VFGAASSTDGVHVYEGDARRRQRRGLEQKMVDVMLAVDMLSHTFRRNMLSTTLLSGDADFKPLMYPADETSSELLRAADVRVKLGWYDLRSLLTESSQKAFVLPNPGHTSPETQRGQLVFGWNAAGKEHGIYIRSDGQILVTREDDPLNTLHMSHANFDLLRECCLEARDIVIPDAGVAALQSISPTRERM
jgi:NYN domain